MKSTSKLACLFSLWLLTGLCMLASASASSDKGVSIDLSTFSDMTTVHRARLTGLYLVRDTNDENNSAYMSATTDTLDIYNGLIVSKNVLRSDDQRSLVVVWWWEWNTIADRVNYSGIAWWTWNQIHTDISNAVIGGGNANQVWSNGGVIAWGEGNNSHWWVVLWWKSNISSWWTVLWWQNNKAWENALAMWNGAKWEAWSFVRNDGSITAEAAANSALIWASNWVLIWTYTPKAWVSLVVSWAVKVWDIDYDTATPWKIAMKNGCLYSFDGVSWHVLGKSSAAAEAACNDITVAKTCKFGRVLLQEWDEVDAYTAAYSDNCVSEKVTCTNWKLGTADKYFTSCFTSASNPYHL